MDQRERITDHEEALRACVEGFLVNLWTALPCVVQSYDATKGTCVLQAAIQAKVRNAQGEEKWVDLPPFVDVPVVYIGGGSFVVTFPIAAGDEALCIFASRCIDNWWLQGGAQNTQAEFRLHDLSDGFAIVGPRSQPRKLTGVSVTATQIRTVDGTAFIELTADGKVNITAPGGVHVTGAVMASGEGTFNGGHTVSAHTHPDPQGGTTGTPSG